MAALAVASRTGGRPEPGAPGQPPLALPAWADRPRRRGLRRRCRRGRRARLAPVRDRARGTRRRAADAPAAGGGDSRTRRTGGPPDARRLLALPRALHHPDGGGGRRGRRRDHRRDGGGGAGAYVNNGGDIALHLAPPSACASVSPIRIARRGTATGPARRRRSSRCRDAGARGGDERLARAQLEPGDRRQRDRARRERRRGGRGRDDDRERGRRGEPGGRAAARVRRRRWHRARRTAGDDLASARLPRRRSRALANGAALAEQLAGSGLIWARSSRCGAGFGWPVASATESAPARVYIRAR